MKVINAFLIACLALQSYDFSNSLARTPSRRLSWTSPRTSVKSRDLTMVSTDAPKTQTQDDFGSSPMSGMFTNSSPESRRVIPTNTEGKTKFKIVYVVLESQYQSSLTKACNAINNGKESVAVEAVGYLLEELRNPAVLEQFKADVHSANIFIGSLIFVQELAEQVILVSPDDLMEYFSYMIDLL